MANNLNFGGAGAIKLSGVDRTWRNIATVGKAVATRVSKAALKKSLAPVVKKARALAPVGKGPLGGMLRDSIEAKITSKKGTDRGVAGPTHRRVRVGTRKSGKNKGKPVFKDPARYGHLQEFGTSHSAAHPFLRPAWETEGADKALDVYTTELNLGLDREVKKLSKVTS